MKNISLFLLLISSWSFAQKPKIMVGIVVDQMRQDYLYRFADKYQDGGFKRLMNMGFQFKNAHYNYIPTYTAPGHAAIYTGTTPSNNGIIANNWYSREKDMSIYCVSDPNVSSVGGTGRNGKMSPKNLKASTVTDEIRLSSNFQSKVIGVSIKDRGSILPAGHAPTGAYWFDPHTGEFMTSTYYTEELPEWVTEFNQKRLTAKYLDSTWSTLLPIEQYIESTTDDVPYERPFKGKNSPTFPYPLKELVKENGAGLIRTTPFGNTLVMDMALAAIEGEKLGEDDHTDFLAVSFSSTDYVGHAFGPNSIELEDTYLRLDLEIKRLLDYLDANFQNDYIAFLTADHGVVNVPLFLEDNQLVGGYLNAQKVEEYFQNKVKESLGEGKWIVEVSNDQVYLDRGLIKSKGMILSEVQEVVKNIVLSVPEVSEAFTADELAKRNGTSLTRTLLENGYSTKLSGDVLARLNAGYINNAYGKKGTTHGSGYAYDTHVPMIFFGMGIPNGESVRKVKITDIAPSIAMMLDVSLPNSVTGNVLVELFD